jgi:hypothetical protein
MWSALRCVRNWSSELANGGGDLRLSAPRCRLFGSEVWVIKIAKQLEIESTINSRGRPKAALEASRRRLLPCKLKRRFVEKKTKDSKTTRPTGA